MSYRNQSVINSRGGSITMSSTENREYISMNSYGGANMSLNNAGVTVFSPNNHQKKVDNDDFEDVANDKSSLIRGKKFDRVNNDYSIIVGDALALNIDSYGVWNEKFSKVAAAVAQPDIKKPTIPVLPGAPLENIPPMFANVGNKNVDNPAIKELTDNLKSGKTLNDVSIPKVDFSGNFKQDVTSLKNFLVQTVANKITDAKNFASGVVSSIQGIGSKLATQLSQLPDELKSPKFLENLQPTSPSTQGGNYEINTAKEALPELITETQKELMPIEANLGDGGSMNVNVARNARWVVGATVNNNPQATVDMVGRQVPSAVFVTGDGCSTAVAGAPEVTPVDNHSMFPCGTLTMEVGNRFSVKSGGGGISFNTCGGIDITTDTILKMGGLQTIVGSQDVVIKGDKNVSIDSDNLNLTSGNQIVLNGNTGVNMNLLVKGGAYVNGELCVNHITAPREIQETLIGFTKEGALGFLRSGEKITGSIILKNFRDKTSSGGVIVEDKVCQFEIMLDAQTGLAVELTPHGHEFPNIPLNLQGGGGSTSAQGAVRDAAQVMNFQVAADASGIDNGNKYPKTPTDPKTFIINDSSKRVNAIGMFGS